MLVEADCLRLVQYVHQVNTASCNEKTISVTGDYKDGCEASVCFDMDMNRRGKVSSLV